MRTVPSSWMVLAGTALAAAAGPLNLQLAFVGVAIGVIGMAHGAGDLAVVVPARRLPFLALYGAVAMVCLIWWLADPALALPLFLLASAVHFGMEDAPDGGPVERVARGVGLVAIPATLHLHALAGLLQRGGESPAAALGIVWGLATGGALAAAFLLPLAWTRRDARLGVGVAALLLLPPLVGFATGFLILHALPQTRERQLTLGQPSMAHYLRATAPVLLAALVVAAVVALIVLRYEPTGVRALFAAIAALAMPHLLVTPWFERGNAAPVHRRVPLSWRERRFAD